MPVSIWLGLEDAVATIVSMRPHAILDVGIGFGLWGHLLRQYLDVWEGHIQRADWQLRIDGVEIEASRVQPHSEYLYTEIYIGDARQVVPACAKQATYDVILFGDVLEHLPKQDAMLLLKQAIWLAGSAVVVRIPLGEGWREEGRTSPDHHRSKWWVEDFRAFDCAIKKYSYFGLDYGVVTIKSGETKISMLQSMEGRLQQIEQALERIRARQANLEVRHDE